MKFEIVVESVSGAITAERTGADRVELVSALVDGGLTPTVGTVERTLDATSRIGVFPIIRPRGGDFVFDEHEAAVMERDTTILRKVGVPGIVVGALTPDGGIDRPLVERLMAAADGAEVTFHRAFDVTADPRAALDELIDMGVTRVLTSGLEATAGEGAPLIAELVRRAADRIIVMPGGGVREETAGPIVAATGVGELHFSGTDTAPSPARHRNPKVAMGGGRVPPESERRVTSAERIVRIMRAAKG